MPWDLRRGRRQGWYYSRRPSGPASHWKGGSGDVMCPPDLLVCTPVLRPGSPGSTGAITTAGALQDDRRHPRGTKDEIQDNSNARRLPTVYFLQCPTTVPPRFRGKRRLPCPHSCTPPFLMTIKGGGGLAERGLLVFLGWLGSLVAFSLTGFSLPRGRSGTTEHSSQPTPLLAETWEPSSLSRLACIPYYKHSGCKIIQCPRTPPCWTYGPAAETRINPCVTVLPLALISETRKQTAFTSWDPNPRVRTPTKLRSA